LGVPLSIDGCTLGLVEWTDSEAGRFGDEDEELAAALAHYVTPALRRVQLLDDACRRLRELAELPPSEGRRGADPAAVLEPLVIEAQELTGARHAFVFLRGDGARLRCVAAVGDQQARLLKTVLRGDGTLGGWNMMRGAGGGRSDRQIMADMGIENPLILPLRVSGEPMGMIGVGGPPRGRSFGRDAIRLMTHLASQASLSIERLHHGQPGVHRYDYEMVFRSSPLGVGILGITGEIRTCNPALADVLVHSDRRLVGSNLAELMVRSDGQRLLRALEEVAITGQRRQVDVRVRVTQGENRHVRISLALGNLSGEPGSNLVALVEDVTPLKILERERVEHLRELREKHAELRDLDQLKSRFVSNVSHELRTPLAVIKLYATLARKGRPEKQPHYLQTIEQETHRLETMVENILDLTRMDRQALRVNAERLSAGEVIGQVLQVYAETAQKRGVELQNRVQGPLPPIWADRNHLIQILTNLVDNAIKYTPRGGQVWVAAREMGAQSRSMLEIAVGDTGAGIAEDEQEKVFERFYRGSNNTPGSTGTGLGLAIVQELMVQHGGCVTVQSRVGEGSIFALQFPLALGDDEEE
jgi:PAS domain S-box-containing protein